MEYINTAAALRSALIGSMKKRADELSAPPASLLSSSLLLGESELDEHEALATEVRAALAQPTVPMAAVSRAGACLKRLELLRLLNAARLW